MEESLKSQMEINSKISAIVKERQSQISELKIFFDKKGRPLYKDVIMLNDSLTALEEVKGKSHYRLAVENLYSLSLSLGKVLDLNNSVKTLLLSIKIFEEHESYIKTSNSKSNKSFLYKMFEKGDSSPIIKNEIIKNKFLNYRDESNTTSPLRDFYQAIYRNDGNFWTDFNKYLNFQMDPKVKNKDNFKLEDFSGRLTKLYYGSTVNYFKFYTRVQPVRINLILKSFDLDLAKVVLTSCDVFFMLYNKLMDKVCHQANIIDFITKLDNYIYKHFIEPLANDLQHLAEFITKRETDELLKNLDKLYN